jgi:hypothetical protein
VSDGCCSFLYIISEGSLGSFYLTPTAEKEKVEEPAVENRGFLACCPQVCRTSE